MSKGYRSMDKYSGSALKRRCIRKRIMCGNDVFSYIKLALLTRSIACGYASQLSPTSTMTEEFILEQTAFMRNR